MGISQSGMFSLPLAAFVRRFFVSCVPLLLVCVVGVAHAQANPTETDRAKARTAMNEADRMREAGDLRGALAKYLSAHEILHFPTSGLELASAQAALGLLVEARITANDTANLPVGADEPEVFAESRHDAANLAAELETRVPALSLIVTPEVTHVLRIDGIELPERAHGFRFRTNPGPHVVEIEAPGYEVVKQKIELQEGAQQLLQIALKVSSSRPTPQPPTLATLATPEAAVSDTALRSQRVRGYVAVVAGGAVVLGGAISGVLSFTETSSAKRECESERCPERLRNRLQTANTLANIANLAVSLGVLGIGYGMYEFLTLPEPRPEQLQRVQVYLDTHGAYAAFRGEL